MKGKVKWFNDEKGYGFIASEAGGDIFVHFSAVQMPGRKSLEEGDNVEFEIVNSEKGPKAAAVVKV